MFDVQIAYFLYSSWKQLKAFATNQKQSETESEFISQTFHDSLKA